MTQHRRRARGATRISAAALVVLAAVASHAPAAPAAVATLTKVGNLDSRLAGNFGPPSALNTFSSPTIADLDNDGAPEIVTATVDGKVIAYRPDRTVKWIYDAGRTSIQSAPAVSDVTGDGRADVVVGTMDGRVLLIHGYNGQLRSSFSDGGLQGCQPTCFPRGFFATPAIGDVNGDGAKDIVASSYNHFVYAWSRSGTLLFKKNLYDTIWSSPAIADIDRNGTNEVIVGGDVDASNPVLGGPSGGMVWVLRGTGATYPGYPKRFPGQVIWSSPALTDLNGDSRLDIVVGTGLNYPSPAGRQLIALTAVTAQTLWVAPTPGRVFASPAVADVDGNGRPEVVVVSEGGLLTMFNGNGTKRWEQCDLTYGTSCNTTAGTFASPVVADVDDDGALEVVTITERRLRIRTASTGALESEGPAGTAADNVTWGSPTIGEIGGRTTIAYQAHVFQGHGGPARANDLHRVQVFTTGTQLCQAPWPTAKGGPARVGRSWESVNPPWLPFRCPGDFVAQQYQDFLGRAPDATGRSFWSTSMREGRRSGARVIAGFLRSAEFGTVVDPVVRISFGLTGTFPTDADAVRAAANRIRGGTSAATVAQDAVAADPRLAAMDDAAFVREVYGNLYRRQPTPSELTTETGRLASGTTRGAFVIGHVTGAAAASLNTPVDVTMVYLGMLDREPDQRGFDFWVAEVGRLGPDRLIRGFQSSTEYRNRVT